MTPPVPLPPFRCPARPLLQPPPGGARLWVSLPLVLSSICEKKHYWVEISWLTWPLKNIPFIWLQKLACSAAFYGSLFICTMKCCLIGFTAFGWIWAEFGPVHFKTQPAASISSHIINKHQRLYSTGGYARTVTLHPPCLTDDVRLFGCWAVPFPL